MIKYHLLWCLALFAGIAFAGDDLTRIGNRTIERVCLSKLVLEFRIAIGPFSRRSLVGLRTGNIDKLLLLTDCTIANALIIRTIHRPGSAEQVVGFRGRCLRCMLSSCRLSLFRLSLRMIYLEHSKAHPVDS